MKNDCSLGRRQTYSSVLYMEGDRHTAVYYTLLYVCLLPKLQSFFIAYATRDSPVVHLCIQDFFIHVNSGFSEPPVTVNFLAGPLKFTITSVL